MEIKNATYKTSAVNVEGMVRDNVPQIAVVGRSNVGKSSFINFITGNSKLCRTSSEPGRTRMINYFDMNKGQFYFVDLPGYGYAKASKKDRVKWASFIETYLNNEENIANVFCLVDLRHAPSALDKQMINALYMFNLPFTIIATKMDKIPKTKVHKHIKLLADDLKVGKDNIYPISSFKKQGGERVYERIEDILDNFEVEYEEVEEEISDEEIYDNEV